MSVTSVNIKLDIKRKGTTPGTSATEGDIAHADKLAVNIFWFKGTVLFR
jgi:hypothetical protein